MRALKRRIYKLADFFREMKLVTTLWLPDFRKKNPKPEIPVIASMTTYPPRIGSAWIAIETLLRQSVRPYKLLLVMNVEEFPDKKIPRRIYAQTRRGLEIMWVERNGRSYDKLIPVRQNYPSETIATFDDDKYFPKNLLSDLYQASIENPGAIIGSRGWVIRAHDDDLRYGINWTRASAGAKGRTIFAPGGNGCVYPPKSLAAGVADISVALELCPTADDIWFWGAHEKAESDVVCLGHPPHRPIMALKFSPALSNTNRAENDAQFQLVLDHWKIRDLVLSHVRNDELSRE